MTDEVHDGGIREAVAKHLQRIGTGCCLNLLPCEVDAELFYLGGQVPVLLFQFGTFVRCQCRVLQGMVDVHGLSAELLVFVVEGCPPFIGRRPLDVILIGARSEMDAESGIFQHEFHGRAFSLYRTIGQVSHGGCILFSL